MNIVEFVEDPSLLGLSVSPAQRTLLKASYGLQLDHEEHELFRACTGRETVPAGGFSEVTCIAGARAGKDSRIAVPVLLYEAFFGGHEKHLAKGERAIVPLVAQDSKAAKIAFSYAREYLTNSTILAAQVDKILATEITLTNGMTVATFPCTHRSLRGWSIPCGVLDELAYFRLEGSADSDVEIQTSIRRGMLSFPKPRLIKISTPYMRSGVLYDDFRRSYGQEDPDRLVWRASSRLMNPTLTAERLEQEKRLDPVRYAREYEAAFTEDVDAFLPGEWVDDAIVEGRKELPYVDGSFRYFAACDPSGGGADAFTFSVCHNEKREGESFVVQDVMKGWSRTEARRVDLESVVDSICDKLGEFKLSQITGDRYSANWVVEAFKRKGVRYLPSKLSKSEAYLELAPLLSQGKLQLLDHPLQSRELRILERRPRAGGKDQVDHPRGQHDDHANVLALAATLAAKPVRKVVVEWV